MRNREVYDEVTVPDPVPTMCTEEEGKTRQDLADGTRIQNIVDRMMEGGLPELRQGTFADVSDIKDLHSAVEQVRRAQLAFNALPPKVRGAFDNDPAKFTDAFQSEEGIAKLRSLNVLPEPEAVVLDREEGAREERAAKRAAARAEAARVEAARRGDMPKA